MILFIRSVVCLWTNYPPSNGLKIYGSSPKQLSMLVACFKGADEDFPLFIVWYLDPVNPWDRPTRRQLFHCGPVQKVKPWTPSEEKQGHHQGIKCNTFVLKWLGEKLTPFPHNWNVVVVETCRRSQSLSLIDCILDYSQAVVYKSYFIIRLALSKLQSQSNVKSHANIIGIYQYSSVNISLFPILI